MRSPSRPGDMVGNMIKELEITVTDASLFLGRVQKGAFLSGKLGLASERVDASMARLGKRVNLDARSAAEGVLEVARAEVGHRCARQHNADPSRVCERVFRPWGTTAA